MLSPVDRRRALMRPAVQRIRGAAFARRGVSARCSVSSPGSACPARRSRGPPAARCSALNARCCGPGRRSSPTRCGCRLWSRRSSASSGSRGRRPRSSAHPRAGEPRRQPRAVGLAATPDRPRRARRGRRRSSLVGRRAARRTSLDALARRSSLVAQLRFAVTMQDLRTVILLRRQLTHEHTRRRPWLRLPRRSASRSCGGAVAQPAPLPGRPARADGVLRRDGRRVPGRWFHGTTPPFVVTGVLLFVLGLEAMEPLSQEVDQPDRTDCLPDRARRAALRHLVAPLVALVPFAVVGARRATVAVLGHQSHAWRSPCRDPRAADGARRAPRARAINIVRDAPDPLSSTPADVRAAGDGRLSSTAAHAASRSSSARRRAAPSSLVRAPSGWAQAARPRARAARRRRRGAAARVAASAVGAAPRTGWRRKFRTVHGRGPGLHQAAAEHATGMTPTLATRRTDQVLRRPARARTADARRDAGAARRARRAQRQRQDDAAADGRRPARPDRRHACRSAATPRERRRPARLLSCSPTTRRSTTTCRCGSTSSTSPGCTASTTGQAARRRPLGQLGLDRPARRPPDDVQPRPAPEGGDHARVRSARSRSCSSTSRSSASTCPARTRCSSCSTRRRSAGRRSSSPRTSCRSSTGRTGCSRSATASCATTARPRHRRARPRLPT